MVAGFMEGSPATVVPGVHWVTLICKETKAFIRLFDVTDSVCTFFFLHTIFMNTPNKSFIFEPIDVLIKLHDAGLLFFFKGGKYLKNSDKKFKSKKFVAALVLLS